MTRSEPDRLAPAARPLVQALSEFFPDVGGAVTDAAEARRLLALAPAHPLPPPQVSEVTDRTVPGPEGAPELPVRIYRPYGEAGPRPTVVFLHGGGWVLCDLETHDRTARELCRASGAVLVSVDYRLAPEVRFPEPVEDAYAAVRWCAAHVDELGGDPAALVVAGDSAGGSLAAGASLMARDRGGPRIALQALVYPATDSRADTDSHRLNAEGYYLTRRAMRWFAEQYFGPDGDRDHPYAAPVRADLTGLPPAHVVTAGCDPLCDEGRAYAARLREFGIGASEGHFPTMFHGFLGFGELLPEAAEAMRGLGEAVAAAGSSRRIGGGDPGLTA
ncbi:alpha/beta hydrolase [Streptomyces iconiensis]|uniref:Alpha/beta hydrolase n=1 Tax=Streptomyces iconiensis TaxID=1384038 RepID=A0ABT7A7H9_9ACTN|nr:alpha/beta hydrolase [Streptomyces iconiensis]MDJ1137281.1 alpha/beta hydrolase [Streptomyces iconiensis]